MPSAGKPLDRLPASDSAAALTGACNSPKVEDFRSTSANTLDRPGTSSGTAWRVSSADRCCQLRTTCRHLCFGRQSACAGLASANFPLMKRAGSPRRATVRACKKVCGRGNMPLPAAGCPDAALIELLGDGDHADRSSGLNIADDRQDIIGEPTRLRAQNAASHLAGLANICPIAERGTLLLLGRQCGLCSLRYQSPLLFGQCCVEVQHEGISVAPQLGDDECHALDHQAGDECDVA